MSQLDSYRTYSATDLQNARTKGKLVGWVQGAAVSALGFFLLGLIGWIPLLALVLVVAVVLYKLFR